MASGENEFDTPDLKGKKGILINVLELDRGHTSS